MRLLAIHNLAPNIEHLTMPAMPQPKGGHLSTHKSTWNREHLLTRTKTILKNWEHLLTLTKQHSTEGPTDPHQLTFSWEHILTLTETNIEQRQPTDSHRPELNREHLLILTNQNQAESTYWLSPRQHWTQSTHWLSPNNIEQWEPTDSHQLKLNRERLQLSPNHTGQRAPTDSRKISIEQKIKHNLTPPKMLTSNHSCPVW